METSMEASIAFTEASIASTEASVASMEASTEAWKLPRKLLSTSTTKTIVRGLPRKLPWKLLASASARSWRHVKAMDDIFPLRHLHGGHGSSNGFNGTLRSSHGTRGSFHGNSHGLLSKINNHAGERPRNVCTSLGRSSTYEASMEFKASTAARTENRKPGRPGVAHVHGLLMLPSNFR